MSRSRGWIPAYSPLMAVPQYSVGDKCPCCHKAQLKRGVKKDDKVQVYCPKCGFTAQRVERK